MYFVPHELTGAYIVELEKITDSRGYFARAYCQDEFEEHGLAKNVVQSNISYNIKSGTLRGMHFQRAPNTEAKLVRCTRGGIFDVIIDLNDGSPTYGEWRGIELSAENNRALYIPEGFAHGFQTLLDDTEVFYQMYDFYAPESAGGIRWNDPAFSIQWPLDNFTVSDKDKSYPDFDGFVL